MSDETERLLAGLDAPRPLPPELREQLFERLTSGAETSPLPLGDELDARLRQTLSDPVAALLADVDAPRPLGPALHDRLARQLTAGRLRATRRAQRFLGAAAVVVLMAAVALVATYGGSRAHRSPSESAQSNGGGLIASEPPVAGGTGTFAGGSTTAGSSGAAGAGAANAPGVAPRPTPASPPPGTAASPAAGLMAGDQSAPQVRSVSPDAGPVGGGTDVTIRGSGISDAIAVTFGGRSARFAVRPDGSIDAVTPPMSSPATVDVVVHVRSGAVARLASAFSYLPRPAVSGLSPSTGPAAGGTWVTVSGAALLRATEVRFGDTAATRIEVVSDSTVRALSPQHSAGSVDVTVTTPGGTSPTSVGGRFTYLP